MNDIDNQSSDEQHSRGPLHGIISWFAQNSVAANLLLVGMIIVGFLSYSEIRKEAFPSLAPNTVTISVSYDSGDAKQAEEGIAIKIEDALETVAGIKRITSTSDANGSTVIIQKQSDYDLTTLLTDVKTKVDAINNFPSDADKPVIDKQQMQDHALWIQLYGDADRASLQRLAEDLKTDLLAKSGIRDLSIKAKSELMISVEVDESKLQAYGLTISDIARVINAESATPLTTSLRNGDKVMRLKASTQAYERAEFEQIPVSTTSTGAQITVGDIATVTDTFADDTFTLSRYNQQNAMAIEIVMDSYGDVTQVVEQASDVVEQWRLSNVLPVGVNIETWFDKSTMITERLSLLGSNAATGIILVFIVLALFLNIRVAFWVAAGLPFIFFGTLFFMRDSFMGLTINEMTTFGFIMALGIVVDDAVVVGESVYTTRREKGDTVKNTILGVMRVAVPTIFGVLTTVAAFVALANVSGDMGQIYAQFATVVTICLLLSVVESKLILPSHLAHLNTHKDQAKKGISSIWPRVQHAADASLQWFNLRVYTRVIDYALKFRYAVICGFVALFIFVVGMPMTGAVRVAFFPDIVDETASANLEMQNDASFGQTHNNLLHLENMAIQVDRNLRNEFGENTDSTSQIRSLQVLAEGDREGSVTVQLKEDATYNTAHFAKEWKAISGSPEGMKGLKFLSSMQMVDNFKVELKSTNPSTVESAGLAIKAALQRIEGVGSIDDNLDRGEPQIRFKLTEQGRSLGMDTASLSQQVLQSFGGEIVQRFQRNKDEVKVRVRYPEVQRQTLADIKQAQVRTSAGVLLPLTTVADITSEYQKDEITRIGGLRTVYISANLDKDKLPSNELVAKLQRSIVPELERQYPDLSVHFAGEAEEQAETMGSMLSMFVVALLVIYICLAIPLKSYIQPGIIMLAIPFGIVGAILGHWWNDLTISILSLNGILALSGVVVNDSLLLVSRFNEIIRDKSVHVKDAIMRACTGRLRAVLLTSITTFAGLMPLLGETSMQAQFLIPAAASLAYGILFATLITLVLIPSMLYIQHEVKSMLVKLLPVKSAELVDDVS